jgi:hypothetical protein
MNMKIPIPFLKRPIRLGDVVAAAAAKAGKKKKKGCGCADKHKRWNRHALVPWSAARPPIPRSVREIPNFGEWTEPPHVPAAWSRSAASRNPRTGTDVEMFTHTSGRIMIWEIIGGAYRRSHGFCCQSLKLKAEQRFAELCQ